MQGDQSLTTSYEFHTVGHLQYQFLTDRETVCLVTFLASEYQEGTAIATYPMYDIILRQQGGEDFDQKVGNTVCAIIEEVLQDKRILISFTCLASDGRELARMRKFTGWYRNSEIQDLFRLWSGDITSDEDDTTIKYAVIFSEDHPEGADNISSTLDDLAYTYSNKYEDISSPIEVVDDEGNNDDNGNEDDDIDLEV